MNDLFGSLESADGRSDAFSYSETDRFPLTDTPVASPDLDGLETPLGMIADAGITPTAARIAEEVVGLLGQAAVRDRMTGVRRPARPGDVAILFRTRDSHREFEKSLERRGVSTYVYKGLGFFDADEVQDVVALLKYLADPSSDIRAAAFLRSRLVRLSDAALASLAPRIAAALLEADLPAPTALSPTDRQRLDLLRRAVPRWLPWVDRMTPAELLRSVLAETAFEDELGGARHLQARENLKKLRSLIRRFQNRGFVTLARVADHLDRLATGDEANAAIDARDSVSLMTVHAAKGLEFPIVFVVNMGRGISTVRAPIRVSLGPSGAPSVAVADYQSEADEDAVAREREETKRLLYVALTRARDRLYLSGSVTDGAFRTTRGSLGEVLPQSVKVLFVEAASNREASHVLRWQGRDGVHSFLAPVREAVAG